MNGLDQDGLRAIARLQGRLATEAKEEPGLLLEVKVFARPEGDGHARFLGWVTETPEVKEGKPVFEFSGAGDEEADDAPKDAWAVLPRAPEPAPPPAPAAAKTDDEKKGRGK